MEEFKNFTKIIGEKLINVIIEDRNAYFIYKTDYTLSLSLELYIAPVISIAVKNNITLSIEDTAKFNILTAQKKESDKTPEISHLQGYPTRYGVSIHISTTGLA